MMEKLDGAFSADAFQRLAALETENEQLRRALESRIILEQAKGAMSVRFGVPVDVAFEMMRGLARSQRREIHAFAAEIVANGGRFSAQGLEGGKRGLRTSILPLGDCRAASATTTKAESRRPDSNRGPLHYE